MDQQVEITSIYSTQNGALLGGIDIIPDPSVNNGYKETKGNRVFISPMNYDDIKGVENADGVILAISLLKEK